MLMCDLCGKGPNKQDYSRHRKGRSGAGGTWRLRAPIHSRLQKPNLHAFKGLKLCTKCLRTVKKTVLQNVPKPAKDETITAAA